MTATRNALGYLMDIVSSIGLVFVIGFVILAIFAPDELEAGVRVMKHDVPEYFDAFKRSLNFF